MNLRPTHRLTLLALAAPTLAVPLSTAVVAPAAAERPDEVASAYVVDEWADGGPTLPAGTYSRVEVTYDATFGITRDGQVRTAAWPHRSSLQAPAFDRPIVDVTAGTTFGLAIDDLGKLRTWGSGVPVPEVDMTETYLDVAAVAGSAIGLTADGELRYWGSWPRTFDEAEVATSDIVSVDVNSASAVALTSEGKVLSAGYALDGTYYQSSPFPADRADETFVAVDAGVSTALGLTADGEIVAWGSYQNGEQDVPALPTGRRAVAVSAGFWMSAAVLDDGTVITWGTGERQQLPPLRAGLAVVDVHIDRYRTAVTYAALESTTAPTITGTPEFGTELTASAGEWSDAPDEVHYEWTLHEGGTTKVVGTDSATYTPTAADASGTLEVTVTAERDGFVSASSTSERTEPVARREFTTAPVVTVTGVARVGETLTASATDAVPAPDEGTWTWFRTSPGDDAPAEPIHSADGPNLALTPDLVGAQVFANRTVVKSGYEPTFHESPATTVAPGSLGAATVQVSGTAKVGETLTASTNGTTPAADGTAWSWWTTDAGAPAPIAGATSGMLALTPALVGRSVVARATFTRAGYDDAIADSAPVVVSAASTSTSTTSAPVTAPTVAAPLPAAKLRVKARKVVAGKKATIKVSGLAAGETVTVRIQGRRATATANASGSVTVRIKVTGKPGKRTVKVTGASTDRTGTTKLRVVRARR